ncbi:MAG: flagellar hook-basal body complex protein FliE [Anaerovoracaceae bacterium]|jgi:flagellar hook-basal body complex protein FliE
MFIVPMNSSINIDKVKSLTQDSDKTSLNQDGNNGSGFKEILQDMVQNVEDTEAVTKMDAYNLAMGNMDDMHTMMINAAKADIALQTMVQIRNKVLEAYSEIMRTNL